MLSQSWYKVYFVSGFILGDVIFYPSLFPVRNASDELSQAMEGVSPAGGGSRPIVERAWLSCCHLPLLQRIYKRQHSTEVDFELLGGGPAALGLVGGGLSRMVAMGPVEQTKDTIEKKDTGLSLTQRLEALDKTQQLSLSVSARQVLHHGLLCCYTLLIKFSERHFAYFATFFRPVSFSLFTLWCNNIAEIWAHLKCCYAWRSRFESFEYLHTCFLMVFL